MGGGEGGAHPRVMVVGVKKEVGGWAPHQR
jgi:hypothetical protein